MHKVWMHKKQNKSKSKSQRPDAEAYNVSNWSNVCLVRLFVCTLNEKEIDLSLYDIHYSVNTACH